MKLFITRKYKKKAYTIGTLEINGQYFCDTLEPVDRGLTKNTPVNEITKVKKKHLTDGRTAIPTGAYRIKMKRSPSFDNEMRGYIEDIPGFSQVLIHEGNYPKNTRGCILVGKNQKVGTVLESNQTIRKLVDKMLACKARGEPITIEIH